MSEATRVTYNCERLRAFGAGVLETAAVTFLMLIAVKHYQAGPVSKGILAAGGSLGLLLAPFTVAFASRLGWPVSLAASRVSLMGCACYLLAAVFPYQALFIPLMIGGLTAMTGMVPFLTQMLSENYPAGERGARFSRTVMIRIAAAALFSFAGGILLSGNIERFPFILLCFSGSFLFSSSCLKRCPTKPITREGGSNPLRAFRYVRQDKAFRTMLTAWMLMGVANLMMLPLRVEYLGNPRYGLAFSAGAISLFTGVIPNVSRFLMSTLWGRLFDRVNFFKLRAIINVGFACSILLFFSGFGPVSLAAAAAVHGASHAGGDIAWSLWVTKIAPPNRVADYMAVHTFMNGIRSALAPLLAFAVIQGIAVRTLSWAAAGLILASILLLVPHFKSPAGERRREPLVEEIAD